MPGPVEPWILALVSVAIVSVVSLVGAVALTLPSLRSHRLLLILVAVAAGTLMGDSFLHILPEAVSVWEHDGIGAMALWILLGFVAFFVLEIVLRARHAHAEIAGDDAHEHHAHGPGTAANHADGAIAPFAWANLIGDGIHNLLDGAVIATAYLVDTGVGIATTIAVVIHEVPQELGDFAVLLRAGLKPAKALALNFASAVLAVVGALIVLVLPVEVEVIEAYGLPLIIGAFVYIAAADLIPELHHHSRGREAVIILVSFLAGLAIMYGIVLLEVAGILDVGHGHDH